MTDVSLPHEPRTGTLSPAAAFVGRHQKVLACLVSVALLLAVQAAFHISTLIGDAAGYWGLSSRDEFGIRPSPRGYVYPLLLMPLRWICDATDNPMPVLKAGLAVVYGVLLPLLVPAAFREAFGGRTSFLRRLVPVVLLAALFPGLLVYPLSDVPALLMTLAGVLCCLRAVKPEASGWRAASFIVAAGFLVGAAYNTRPIYLFCLIGFALFLAFSGAAVRSRRSRAIAVALFAAGALLVSLPQLVINKRTHGVASLAVVSSVKGPSLFASQLVWGITMQRYETSLGPVPTAIYLDSAGTKLLDTIRPQDLMTIPHYMVFVLRHPVDFLGLYYRHFINGLDVRDGQIYTSIPSPARNRMAVANFCVLAMAFLVALTIGGQTRSFPPAVPGWTRTSTILLCLVLLPVAAIVPGAIETRFFLPLHLLAYCVLAAYFKADVFIALWRRHVVWIVIGLVLAAAGFFAVSLSTMSQLQYAWPDNYRPG